MTVTEILVGLSAVFFAVFYFWIRKLPIYRIGDFPIPPRVFLLGHALSINSSTMLCYFHEQLVKYNGLAQIRVGTKVFLLVSDYKFLEWIMNSSTLITKSEEYDYLRDWLGEGILIGTGSRWKAHRKILTPAFHFKMIERHFALIQNASNILVKKLEAHIDKDSVDIHPLVSNFSLDAVCESAMATSINAQENDSSDYIQSIGIICKILIERSFNPLKMFNFIFRLHPDHKEFYKSINLIHDFDNSVITERRKVIELNKELYENTENLYGSKQRIPFLDILLTSKGENGESLSDHAIREEVDTIMFAGYETTASAISFVLYNLAKYPDVQKQAFEEQMNLFGSDEHPEVSFSSLNDMKYLEMVIKESMRLYPPVPFIGRKITEDTYYEGKLLPKGLTLTICINSIHRNPEHFPDPEKFDPSRFDGNAKMRAFSFIPFSAGARNCIGQKFAMTEVKQVVSSILRKFEILPAVPAHHLLLVPEATMKSRSGICVKLKKREY